MDKILITILKYKVQAIRTIFLHMQIVTSFKNTVDQIVGIKV